MSSEVDPAKLKVVELRAKLSARGLDTKGNKAVLVKRLKDALEKELEKELPDTSIADTSTEDLNTTQPEVSDVPEKEKTPEPVLPVEPDKKDFTEVENIETKPNTDDMQIPSLTESISVPVTESISVPVTESISLPVTESISLHLTEDINFKNDNEVEQKENEKRKEVREDIDEPCNKKSRWAVTEVDVNDPVVEEVVKEEVKDEITTEEIVKDEKDAEACEEKKEEKMAVEVVNEQRPEKRRRSSSSPGKSQRRRSKSPIKEDEPTIDYEKVQLNWYDSDLHLQIDKESFLSARPYHDGAFGYVWAGVRATHGADCGKVHFEVKITEELKFEDIIKQVEKGRRDKEKRDIKRDKSEKEGKSETKSDADDKSKRELLQNNGNDECANANIIKEVSSTVDTGDDQSIVKEDSEESKIKEENIDISKCPDVDINDTNVSLEGKGEKDDESNMTEKCDTDEAMEIDKSNIKPEKKEKEEISIPTHLIRIGWSAITSGLQLGETNYSYGFESSGKFVTNKQFSEYGKSFYVGDVVGAYLDFENEYISMTYTVNGHPLPLALKIARSDLPQGFSLFPHILTKNYAFEINLGHQEAWFANPENLLDYVFLDKLDKKVTGPVRPEKRSDCEVIMMCGLPASGKTHWVQKYVAENPEKRYTIIGNTHLLEKMTVNGNPLKNNVKNRWNVMLDKLSKCLNKLVEIATSRRRNYIIDQTNVFPSAQRRKMRPFEGFKRRAVIVVCGEEEQAKRQALQETQDGKDVPDITVLEMKANMSLPRTGDWIDEVTYVELNEQDAKAVVQKYNRQGKDAGFGPTIPRKDYRDDRFNRWQSSRRTDYRGGYRDRNYQNHRYDRGPKHGGTWQNRSNNWGRNDRRDNRSSTSNSRDWRSSSRGSGAVRHQDRGRERDVSRHSSRDNYSRNRPHVNSRGQGSNWQGGGSWNRDSWGSQSNWQQSQSGGWNQGWNQAQGQSKWAYNQGYGQQSYSSYPHWNYYGQYQNWNSQGQMQQSQTVPGASNANPNAGNTWAQYAQQYAQSNTPNQHTAMQKPN